MSENPLDNPIWHALAGEQARFALSGGAARRFRADIGPLAAVRDQSDDGLADLAALARKHGALVLFQPDDDSRMPNRHAGLRVVKQARGVQMIFREAVSFRETDDAQARPLGPENYPEMLALARLTEPGPFAARTADLGGFWGIFDDGRLIAMAGQRLRIPGHAEVSGVCTHPDARGRGLAARLTRKVVGQILAEGRLPILHAYADNEVALALYRRLGFAERTHFRLTACEAAP
ncbi:FR47-like protein [Novosphingobium sp. CF614]|uniref:GNAT family N-acetyltransferase n=1 Tax=Novosphingobium sp. CF614 TaxID=1884364 RepID=UPI0008E69EE1|nr:GNAT family N-acetyltransferase [Novosphingobium sp. CF614]SFG10057.1 FR47-like protein [Novosphingobium sp. CF614]